MCHYTSGDTLIKILSAGELWSTQIACLNDSKEMTYAVDALLEVIERYRKKGVSNHFEPCIKRLEERLNKAKIEKSNAFVACFSSKLDDLSQWRGYGGSAGYALVFDTVALRSSAEALNDRLFPVLYGIDEAYHTLNEAITGAERYHLEGLNAKCAPSDDEWTMEFSDYWFDRLSFIAPAIKHHAFRDEQEWRLLHVFQDEDDKNQKYLQRTSMMTRHLPRKLRAKGKERTNLLPIKAIMVGPTGNARMSEVAVGDLLRTSGYSGVEVLITKIPYRPYL